MVSRPGRFRIAAPLAIALGALALAGCAPVGSPHPVNFQWLVGRPAPDFDPQASPDPVLWSLLRLLNHGLVEEDSALAIVPAAAEEVAISEDGLTYTFHLRPALQYMDGTRCASGDFRACLEAGLRRSDCGIQAWALAAVRGVDRVRPGQHFLPPLGIDTPDDRTLVLHLARGDSLLLRRLALPGVSAPWHQAGADAGGWPSAVGLGPYRVAFEDPGRRLVLARAPTPRGGPHAEPGPGQPGRAPARRGPGSPAAPDSVVVRFAVGAPRTLSMLRGGGADLLWPAPPGFSQLPLPAGFGVIERPASPPRRLLLVMRPDRPPTSKPEARLALAHALNQREFLQVLGTSPRETPWLPGAPPFEFPRLDPEAVRVLLLQGDLGRSLHVMMCYDVDGVAAEVAPAMQGQWAGQGLYISLRGLRGPKLGSELRAGGSHLLLVESQPLLDDLSAELDALVMPARGPAAVGYSTMWRSREFDAWLGRAAVSPGRRAPLRGPRGVALAEGGEGAPGAVAEGGDSLADLRALIQQRLADEMVALPLARLPWRWVEPGGPLPVGFHPHYGPQCLPEKLRLDLEGH